MKDQMERLNAARDKVAKYKEQKIRLESEKESLERSMKEIEEQCKADFEVGVDELPEIIKNLQSDIESSLSKAEEILSGGQ